MARTTIIARTASRPALAALAATLVLVGGACSADTDEVDTAAPSGASGSAPVSLAGNVSDHGEQQVTGATPSVAMELDDSYFAPTYVQADPGAVVTVELENEGTKVHTFTLDDHHVDVSVQPGASAKVDVTMPASGSLHYFCQIHSGAGMQGSFVVGSASSTPSSSSAPTTPATDSRDPY